MFEIILLFGFSMVAYGIYEGRDVVYYLLVLMSMLMLSFFPLMAMALDAAVSNDK